jgi:glycyl-tRNA synthetase|tara:strand:+ start:463 stop:1875 length:1413 start_codon:yes stop_codon:yes gene_type:complete
LNKFYRADKLLEEVMDARMAAKGCAEEAKKEYQIVKAQADAYTKEELMTIFAKYEIKAPESGNDLTEPQEFNLMFPTPIGPTGQLHGYLRPETAQGIFLNFKFCLEQNAGVMPFGIAQVGKVFRNEIAPRSGLIRCREFSQAEIEFFVHPDGKQHSKFSNVAALELRLFASPQQLAAEPPVMLTLGEAVAGGTVANETLGYFIGRTYQFLLRVGCLPEHVRFRQHLPDEMAHYACDCWDAEIEMTLGWVECVGIADRSAFDLTVHAKATNTSLTAQRQLETPRVVEKFGLSKKALAKIGKFFKKDAKLVGDWLSAQSVEQLQALEAMAKAEGRATVTIGETPFNIAAELLEFEKTIDKQNVEIYTPNVIEPSFGVDRILTAMYEHSFYIRNNEVDTKDKSVQGVLALPPEVAPYKCVLLPLDMRVVAAYGELLAKTRQALAAQGLQYKIDESGASIGAALLLNQPEPSLS